MKVRKNRGFSLLELLIVVAIILIIATIAIPSLLRSRQAANESAAVANLRTINTAEVTYLSSAGGNYGDVYPVGGRGTLGFPVQRHRFGLRTIQSLPAARTIRLMPSRLRRTPAVMDTTARQTASSATRQPQLLRLLDRPATPFNSASLFAWMGGGLMGLPPHRTFGFRISLP